MTENELFSVLRRILREHSSPLAFLDARSPEALALSWLVTAEQDPTLRIWDIDKDQTLSPRIIQRYALVVLALSCGGDSWRGVSPWMTQSLKNECDWSLVSCNEQNQVIKLDLEDTDMTGTLPDEISLLTSLVILRLSNNRLKGKLPLSVYSRLTTLEELVVLRNSLSFSIPSEIGLLSNLQALLASQNLITGTLPGEFKLLSNLVVLDLSGTQIEGPVFDFLPYLPRAEYLFIGQTLFSGMIPTDPTAMPSIRYLDVTGLPDLRTIPSTIASLTNLEVLRFGASWRQEIGSMTGTIPSEIGLLSNLVSLIIDDTEIKGTIPSELGNMREVQILGLANNQLTGEIPSTFGNLTKLNELYLYNNKLFGELPTELASLPNLRLLQVYANEAALVIPNNFCESLELKIIYDCEQSCDCCTSGSVGECIDNDGT
jgi:Leucine-rich repeat (LRR) protein